MREDNAAIAKEKRLWRGQRDNLTEIFKMLGSGSSWSGSERNFLFFGGRKDNQFANLSGISGADDPGDSRSFAVTDFDRDGREDILLGNLGYPRLRVLKNDIDERSGHTANRFIALRLQGGNRSSKPSRTWSARDGFGAVVRVNLKDGRTLTRRQGAGDGFMSQSSSTILCGIGEHDVVESVTIDWLSGRSQSLNQVAAGALVTVWENPEHGPRGKAFEVTNYRRLPRR